MEESRTRTAASVLGAERDVCMYSRNVRRRRVAGRRAHPYQVILSVRNVRPTGAHRQSCTADNGR